MVGSVTSFIGTGTWTVQWEMDNEADKWRMMMNYDDGGLCDDGL